MNGYDACQLGFKLKDNPYKKGTKKHSKWEKEWLEQMEEIRMQADDKYETN